MKRQGLERKTRVGVASSAAGGVGNLKCVCRRHARPDATQISNPITAQTSAAEGEPCRLPHTLGPSRGCGGSSSRSRSRSASGGNCSGESVLYRTRFKMSKSPVSSLTHLMKWLLRTRALAHCTPADRIRQVEIHFL